MEDNENELTLGEIHRYMWDYVIYRMKEGEDYTAYMKLDALRELLVEGMISQELYDSIMDNHCCVLCYVCHGKYTGSNCAGMCPIYNYGDNAWNCACGDGSLYSRLCKDSHINTAKRIRDVRLPAVVDEHFGVIEDWDRLEVMEEMRNMHCHRRKKHAVNADKVDSLVKKVRDYIATRQDVLDLVQYITDGLVEVFKGSVVPELFDEQVDRNTRDVLNLSFTLSFQSQDNDSLLDVVVADAHIGSLSNVCFNDGKGKFKWEQWHCAGEQLQEGQ